MDDHAVVRSASNVGFGYLAETWCKKRLPLQVLKSAAGYYIGTCDDQGLPCSRESVEFFRSGVKAEAALRSGAWTQKTNP